MGAVELSGTLERTAPRSCRFPSWVRQLPSLGLSNLSERLLPRTLRVARSSNSPVSKLVLPSTAGHCSEAGSGSTRLPALDTCTIPMEPGEIGTGLAGSQESTIERLTENVVPCEFRLRVPGLNEQTGCRTARDACTQPVLGSQESAVHGLPSSQLSGAPPVHWP